MNTPNTSPSMHGESQLARRATQIRSSFHKLATGGDWALTQPEGVRRNLVWFWLDGFFASASDNIVGTYLVVYLLALGATQGQIGLMSSLSSLTAALLLLPGAMLVERIGRRRNIVLLGGGWARMALLILALLPLVTKDVPLIYLAIAFTITRDAMGNLSFPAWMSMTADIVPIEGRGRYFASRNFVMGIAGITVTFLIGLLLTHTSQPAGYQFALALAFVVGLLSVFSFSRLSDRPMPLVYPQTPAPGRPLAAMLRELAGHREFMQFAMISAIWNISLNIAGPFFTIHLVKNLGASATMVGLTSIATSVATMLAQRKLGELNDRWGARRLAVIAALMIPVLPLSWVFINAAWQVILVNLLGGVLWGAFNLASFNYLLMITPAERRPRFSAIFQIIVTVSLAIGAALGSLIVTQWGYAAVFLGSGVLRLMCALLFARLSASREKQLASQAAV